MTDAEKTVSEKEKPKGVWFWTILAVLFVPLPWYVCLFGCKWVMNSLISNFAWFRLIFISPWATPLALLLPVLYVLAIRWILGRILQKPTKKNIFIVVGVIAGLFIVSYLLNN